MPNAFSLFHCLMKHGFQAAAFLSAMQEAPSGACYLLAGDNMTLKDFFATVARVSGAPGPFLSVPPAVARLLAAVANRAYLLVGVHQPSLDPVVVEMSQAYW